MNTNIDLALEILTYFIIYSFGGWVLESVFKSILSTKLVNSGFLNGPFCPIYATRSICNVSMFGKISRKYTNTFLVWNGYINNMGIFSWIDT